jgi:hypothetical protein
MQASSFSAPPGEGITYYVDNIHFRRLPDLVPDQLFSFETPDNPATPSVNEQFEGWIEGFQPGHTHSITTTGATDGNYALNIHREHAGSNFKWGSQFILSSDTNPDPEITEIDPVIQARINDMTTRIVNAERVALDLTFNPDEFIGSPTQTKLGIHFSDVAHFFQAEFAQLDLTAFSGETTLTLELPMTSFKTPEASGSIPLIGTGFVPNTPYFRMGISTNSNGLLVGSTSTPIDFRVDNIRLINEVFPLDGDYNMDGIVNAADYVTWQKFVGTFYELPNDPDGGEVGPLQYATWRSKFAEVPGGGSASMPEPSAALFAMACAGLISTWRGAKRGVPARNFF